jgi:hypothetical protein
MKKIKYVCAMSCFNRVNKILILTRIVTKNDCFHVRIKKTDVECHLK